MEYREAVDILSVYSVSPLSGNEASSFYSMQLVFHHADIQRRTYYQDHRVFSPC